jgi:SAM-dependent methyltransferase
MNSAIDAQGQSGRDRPGPAQPAEARSTPRQDLVGHLLPQLYQADATHWWTSGMRRVSHALLDGVALPGGPVLELGCGAGAFLTELRRRFPERLVLGSDVHPLALAQAGPRTRPGFSMLAADVHHLPLPAGACAAVVALDVLDQHGVYLPGALQEIGRVLSRDGVLLMRVSAFAWLYGPHDVAFGTGQRYTAGQLERTLAGAGLRVERVTYANSLLFAPGAVVRLLQKSGLAAGVDGQMGGDSPFSRQLRDVLAVEARWLRRRNFPAGLSLYAIARKIDPSHPTNPGRN